MTADYVTRHLDLAGRLHLNLLEEVARIDGLRRALYHKRLGPKGALALRVLEDLAGQDDGSTALELAERLGLPASTASRVVGDLAVRGWVRFGEHPRDRRCKCLWLTEAGDTARGELLRPLLGDAAKLAKLVRAERISEVHYMAQQHRKVLTTYVRSVRMPKRRRPTPI